MTLAEFDQKIIQLKIVQTNAEAMQLAELTNVIETLETLRVELVTRPLNNIEHILTEGDIATFDAIATAFENGTVEINQANALIDNVIEVGKKLLGL
ncbi:MAG: hypothetical protein COB01_07445 [Lutibacter sp.]|nr:MAG: hypothetical protein COB01_07445 [Lutibacter sp.]